MREFFTDKEKCSAELSQTSDNGAHWRERMRARLRYGYIVSHNLTDAASNCSRVCLSLQPDGKTNLM